MVFRRPTPEILPAMLNGVIVLLLPLLASVLFTAGRHDNVSVIVHPPGWSPVLAVLRAFLRSAVPMSPLAVVASWRTSVHARRWREGDRNGFGIIEATGCGAATAALLALLGAGGAPSAWAILPGLLLVGTIGAIVGLAVGLLLHICAVIVLVLAERAMNV